MPVPSSGKDSASSTLDALEYADAHADQRCSNKDTQQGICGDHVEDITDQSGDSAGSTQNSRQTSSFLKSLLLSLNFHKGDNALSRWLREMESNHRYQVQGLECYRYTIPRYM